MEIEGQETIRSKHEDLSVKVLVQPDDVQVKRVGRASCIEPEIKVCLESDALYPIAVTLNAYLKVLGKDNKHKMILLAKSKEMMMTKIHRREIVNMKLRFLKTIKVQVLKRNLGVARPEASVVFEAVNRHGEVLAAMPTTHFAIISDPRYLVEVKKRRVGERSGDTADSDEDSYLPPTGRGIKRTHFSTGEYEGPLNTASFTPVQAIADVDLISYTHSLSPSTSSPSPIPSPLASPSLSSTPIYLTPLQTLKNTSDFELFADSEEEYKLIKLVESLKYRGCTQQICNFQVLPPTARI